MEKNIYKIALMKKYRFNFKGQISTEDLFGLSLNSLDEIYKDLVKQKKNNVEVSLLNSISKENEEIENKISLIKDIVLLKLEEKELREKEVEEKARKNFIKELIREKELDGLKNSSIEDLKKML